MDASVVVELLLRLPAARAIETRIFALGEALHAPHLLDIEVTQVIRRYAASGFDEFVCRRALEDLVDLPLTRHAHDWLLPRIWSLRNNVTAYDATYVALAEAVGGVLLTKDRRLSAAAGSLVDIEVF